MEVLKASLLYTNGREYEIITECASSNFSETPTPNPKEDCPLLSEHIE
jgi:hypothetical protein